MADHSLGDVSKRTPKGKTGIPGGKSKGSGGSKVTGSKSGNIGSGGSRITGKTFTR